MSLTVTCDECYEEYEDLVSYDAHKRWHQFGVGCDLMERCQALDQPQTLDETRVAYEHWRFHGYLSGCSHAR